MKQTKYVSAVEAVKHILSNTGVFIHGSAATPLTLVQAMVDRKSDLRIVELTSISTLGYDLNSLDLLGHFYINSFFVSESVRQAVNSTRGDYIPVFLSEIPRLFSTDILPLDVALLTCTVKIWNKDQNC
jgi:acyl-CoA hydrolase